MRTWTDKDQARFWRKVEKTPTCWLWTTTCDGKGYPQISINGRNVHAHRLAYEVLVGPIPTGLELDHLCRVRRCVNPAHLEPVTHRENLRRGHCEKNFKGAVGARNGLRRSACKRGHPFTDDNLYIRPNGHRQCRICRRLYQQNYRRPREA